MLYDSGHTVGITTNGVRTIDYWKSVAPKLSYICFSYHPGSHDPQLIEKALESAKHTHVVIRVMMDSRYWDKSLHFYEECSKISEIRTEPVRILPEIANRHIGDDYTPENIEWLFKNQMGVNRKIAIDSTKAPLFRQEKIGSSFHYSDGSVDKNANGNYLITSGQNDFRGWACNIGLESLYIGFDGYVKKGNCGQGGHLFHIDDHEKNELPTAGEICVQRKCFCVTDVMITKAPMLEANSEIIKNLTTGVKIKSEQDYKEYYKDYIRIKAT
jgi:hypothetical protein